MSPKKHSDLAKRYICLADSLDDFCVAECDNCPYGYYVSELDYLVCPHCDFHILAYLSSSYCCPKCNHIMLLEDDV